MTSHFTGTTRKKKMESRKAASEEVRLQTTAKNRQRGSITITIIGRNPENVTFAFQDFAGVLKYKFLNTVNATFTAHWYGTLYKLMCNFASNVLLYQTQMCCKLPDVTKILHWPVIIQRHLWKIWFVTPAISMTFQAWKMWLLNYRTLHDLYEPWLSLCLQASVIHVLSWQTRALHCTSCYVLMTSAHVDMSDNINRSSWVDSTYVVWVDRVTLKCHTTRRVSIYTHIHEPYMTML